MLNEELVTYERLEELLPELLARSIARKVIISTEPDVRYERVIHVLDLAKQNGAGELALLRSR